VLDAPLAFVECRIEPDADAALHRQFRCFVNFEHKPARRELIRGANGSGKSSFLDALLLLRQFVTKGDILNDFYVLSQRTRWLNQPQQTHELEATLNGNKYVYRLVVEPGRTRTAASSV
jgi:AAA15 family ATPase/GTPase